MAGIDSFVNARADMFAANPQGLEQRYSMSKDLLDLLALQKLKKDKEAAQRNLQMQMQGPQGTVKDQLEGQMMQATKQEVAQAMGPGIQQQGQRMAAEQLQQAMAAGLPTQPAPNMVGMARGGIVGYAPGGDVEGVPYSMDALRAFDERRRLERELRAAGVAEADAKALAQDPVSAQNVLRSAMNVRNMPSPAPAGVSPVLSEGTPERDIPVSMDALRRFDARRAAERYTPLGPDASLARKPAPAPDFAEDPMMGASGVTEGIGAYLRRIPEAAKWDWERSGTRRMLADFFGGAPAGEEAVETPAATEPTPLPALPPQLAQPAGGLGSLRMPGTTGGVAPAAREPFKMPERPAVTQAPVTDPRRSRYEDQLARVEAEKGDKMGALIDFLLAAGASGGTSLGRTLMGGGSGLRAREQRLEGRRSEIEQALEMIDIDQAKMAAEEARAAQQRADNLYALDVGTAWDQYKAEGDWAQDEANRALEERKLAATIQSALLRAQESGGQLDVKDMLDIQANARELFPPSEESLLAIANRARANTNQDALDYEELMANPQLYQEAQVIYDKELLQRLMSMYGGLQSSSMTPTQRLLSR